MKTKSKWASRKLFVFLFISLNFTSFFVLTALFAQSSLTAIGISIITSLAFFGAVYCGSNVVDKFLQLKHPKE